MKSKEEIKPKEEFVEPEIISCSEEEVVEADAWICCFGSVREKPSPPPS